VGKWAETSQTLINKGLAAGHFSKIFDHLPTFFGQRHKTQIFKNRFAHFF
jgi:hypothetical protein